MSFLCKPLRIFLAIAMVIPVMISCRQKSSPARPAVTGKSSAALFDVLTPEQTGLNFENQLTETLSMNGLFYEYYYNGGGVAVADFNNDGLQDVYFIANIHPNKLFLNMGNLKFKDVSKESGTADHAGFSTGVTTVDINCDGWMDIYISNSGRFEPEKLKHKLLINKGLDKNGVPVFREEGSKYNLDIPLCSTQAAFFDYDNDNDLDLFLINHYPDIYNVSEIGNLLKTKSAVSGDRLYQNQNGKFIDVSARAGLVNNSLSYALGLGISDLNNDGWPDVYVSNDYAGKDFLYINNGNGTFTENIDECLGHISFSSMGNYLGDFNNDGWSDIITLDMMAEENYGIKASYGSMDPAMFENLVSLDQHHQYMFNMLQMNRGVIDHDKSPVFSEIAQMAGIPSTDWSWGPLLFDMDNDGIKDLFVANGIKRDFINNDYLTFFEKKYREVIETGKVSKNDFVTSVLKQMPGRRKSNYFFRNRGDLTFEKMNGKWVRDIPACSNGAAYADFDNDGDMDIIVNNSDSYAILYKNNAIETGLGNYLEIKLKGPPGNPIGIGAKIILKQQAQQQMEEQYLTRGYLSSISPVLQFGLGTDKIVPELDIIWPDGKEQIIRNTKANQLITLSYSDAGIKHDFSNPSPLLFKDVTAEMKIRHKYEEDKFDDFAREPLLPHKMSEPGPALAVGDVNNDGLDDFYIGGAKGFSGKLYIQTGSGFAESVSQPWEEDLKCEDAAALFFDADNDGDSDLYVVSGSNEYDEGSPFLRDRFYRNEGSGRFIKMNNVLPSLSESGSCVKAGDIDGDGDQDLFTGGRQKPGKYPLPVSSHLLRNDSGHGSIKFTDVTADVAPPLINMGMVTDAVFTDINGDKMPDLVIVGEWMPVRVLKNTGKDFKDITEQSGLSGETGWWNCIIPADVDNDGDIDLIAGNLGLNFKYKASKKYPFELYAKDFDNNGKLDLVAGYYNNDTLYPLNGLKSSSMQLPFIKQKYLTFDAFARATLSDVYGADNLKKAMKFEAENFANCYLENKGDGSFTVKPLGNLAQISAVNSIIAADIDSDGNKDLVIAGNLYGTNVETPRNDAGTGLFLKGDGHGNFKPEPYTESGLFLPGDIRVISLIHSGKSKALGIIAAGNNCMIRMVMINPVK